MLYLNERQFHGNSGHLEFARVHLTLRCTVPSVANVGLIAPSLEGLRGAVSH